MVFPLKKKKLLFQYILNAAHGHIIEDCVEVAVELDFTTFHIENK